MTPLEILNSFVFEYMSILNKLMKCNEMGCFLVKLQADLQYFEKRMFKKEKKITDASLRFCNIFKLFSRTSLLKFSKAHGSYYCQTLQKHKKSKDNVTKSCLEN